jgi:polyhydroxyalkanoic acid synthase PhaR subunit
MFGRGEAMSKKEIKPEAETGEDKSVPDPFRQMIEFYDTYAKSWSNVMSDAVASKGFAEAMGQQMESSLDALTLWRRQMGDVFEQYLGQMSLPTRSQVISLAERLTNVEMAIHDLDEKLDELLDRLEAQPKKKA